MRHLFKFRAFAFAAALLVVSHAADAHIFLDHADPKVGSDVSGSPAEVKVWFTGEIEAGLSGVEVLDADGKQVDKKDGHLDPKNAAAMAVTVPPLPPGTYKVHWHTVCSDGHKTEGNFKFVIKAQR